MIIPLLPSAADN